MNDNGSIIESNVLLLDNLFGEENWKKNVSDVFQRFEGPSVYFYNECLSDRENDFLGNEHVKMMYACLTAWGMHRMGESSKTKIPPFADFSESITQEKTTYEKYKEKNLLEVSTDVLDEVWGIGKNIKASISSAKLVSSSKTLHFVLPKLVPPIDRQYTLRFFYQKKDNWVKKDEVGIKYSALPNLLKTKNESRKRESANEMEARCFREICMQYKNIWNSNKEVLGSVENPIKTIDNAIMYLVKKQKNDAKNPSGAKNSLQRR